MSPTPVPIPTTSNILAVFRSSDWDNPAPGVWEATAKPHTNGGRSPFEAVAIVDPNLDYIPVEQWWWSVHQPETDEPTAPLIPIAVGHAPTLTDAQRQCEHTARAWRDQPLDGLTNDTLVACTGCGDTYPAGEAIERGRCRDPFCGSEIFDGHHIADLAKAVDR
ncbi:MAG: hypothetical protein AAFN30_13625 [Actinomycetota bacterium]